MNDTETEFAAVLETLNKEESDLETTVKELERLRRQISFLDNRRTQLRVSLKENRVRRDSLERRLKIEEQEKRVNEELAVAKDRYADILKSLNFPQEPYEHQFTGAAKFAVAGRALCADKRGLGKTLTAILWRHFIGSKKTLWLAPSKLALQTNSMLHRWDGENGGTIISLVGVGKTHRDIALKIVRDSNDVVVIVNYEAWRRDKALLTRLCNAGFDAVVMDEVHNAKESNKLVAQGLVAIGQAIPKVLQLTGTPILNRPQEIWSPLNILYPDIFPDKKAFQNDFCRGWGNEWYWAPGGEESLAKKIAPFYLARTRDSIGIKIPPPDIITYDLTFEDYGRQKQAYDILALGVIQMLKKMLDDENPIQQQVPSILSLITRQRQMTVWPPSIHFTDLNEDSPFYGQTHQFDVHESVKLDFAFDQIMELYEERERTLLFSNYTEPVYELEKRLRDKGLSVAKYIGSTSDYERTRIETDFNLETAPKNPRYNVLLATYKTVSEGLNLNAARHAILLDREWNPGREEQAIGRIDRLNSKDQATVHIPHVEDSIDDFMRDLIERKRSIVGGFEDATKLVTDLINKLEEDLKK